VSREVIRVRWARLAAVPRALRAEPLWLCLAPALLLLPFLGKAFHIDDGAYLAYGRLIVERPLDAFHQTLWFEGKERLLFDLPNPLFYQTILGAVCHVLGEREVTAHLVPFFFALLGLHGVASLARRLRVSPLAATSLVATSSAFLVMGTTVMPDMALFGLMVASMARLVSAVDDEKLSDAVLAGLLGAAAFLTRYTAVTTLAFLFAYPLLRQRITRTSVLPAGVAGLVVVLRELLNVHRFGQSHFLHTLRIWGVGSPDADHVIKNGFVEVMHLGAQLPFAPLFLVAVVVARPRGAAVALAGLGAAMTHAYLIADRLPILRVLWFAWPAYALLAIALGAAVSAVVPWVTRRMTHDLALRGLLAVWAIGTTFAGIKYVHIASKYMLLPLPAAVLLALDYLAHAPHGAPRRRSRALVSALVPALMLASACLGLVVATDDYRWAGAYRAFFGDPLRKIGSSSGVTYVNAEWGIRYYAERVGITTYRGQPLRSGDWLVRSSIVPTSGPPPWNTVPRANVPITYKGHVVLMGHGAGFYSNAWGLAPFVLNPSDTPEMTVDVVYVDVAR
jgi:hypothetical protein